MRPGYKTMTPMERHAELVYTESPYEKAILGIAHSGVGSHSSRKRKCDEIPQRCGHRADPGVAGSISRRS